VYFLVATQEYGSLLDYLSAGIKGETQEKRIEMSLFVSTGVFYIIMLIWIIKSKFKRSIPYFLTFIVSVLMICIYAASRTVGVPPIGIEYYVGKLDILTKVLQIFIIGVSVYLLMQTKKAASKEMKM
jgi:hypothetical protein